MKGPGLPGFRKNAGSGFYKSSGFNINTSNRSPMKEGEDQERKSKELKESKLAEARNNWLKMTPQERAAAERDQPLHRVCQRQKEGQGAVRGHGQIRRDSGGDRGGSCGQGGAGGHFRPPLLRRLPLRHE